VLVIVIITGVVLSGWLIMQLPVRDVLCIALLLSVCPSVPKSLQLEITLDKNIHRYNTLKMQNWKMQDWILADQIARVENAGLEFVGPNSRAGKCRTGIWQTK